MASRIDLGSELLLSLGCLAANQGEVHLDGRAGLAQLVMDLSRDGAAFFFAHALEAGGKGAQSIPRMLQLLLGTLALRDLPAQLIVHSTEDSGTLPCAEFQ